ncbi:MAG: MoaD/ThiS family protein [Acidobacteria bacterium]|nr:MoaD/ThiS family protein [Acidobacteriota bacterium]MBI3656451.1 MoaD/ThiS family protein [Acidobacteriota bacterium]
MKITVLAFASLAEAWGRKAAVMSFEKNPLTVADVLEAVCGDRSELARYRAILLLSRNGEFAKPDTPLQDGDEVAMFPPVSGGIN